MSIKPCVTGFMVSTPRGIDFARNWFPRNVKEVFLESTKDGEIKRSPDPVTMIEGDLVFYNSSDESQRVNVLVQRAPRTIVAQSPSTVVIHDAVSVAVGESPVADYPSVMQDAFGGRAQIDRPEVASDQLQFGRLFLEADSSQVVVPVGEVLAGETMHFRYVASVQTPGTWTSPSEFEPRWEASAFWVRLIAQAEPMRAAA